MASSLSFSVAISTFNRNDDLERCLDSLSQQTFSDFEVVVSNGGEPEGVRRTVSKFKDLRITVVDQKRKGIVEGRNLGWIHAKGDVVCLIDDDLVVSPQWLTQIRETFLSDERIGGVSGPTIIPTERLKNRDFALFLDGFRAHKNLLWSLIGKAYLTFVLENKVEEVGKILKSGVFTPGSNYPSCLELPGIQEVDYLEACHMCFRRRLLEEIGGFDYIYIGTGEWNEPDFSFKVREKGYRLLFNPEAVTYHHISQGGVFKARTNSFERSQNFIFFYMRWIKPDTLEKFMRFSANLFFINGYWVYKFIQSGNPDWLRGLYGTVSALLEAKKACRL
ncbi:MAG: glycosyltransferase family 2 protein [Candidatus Omnitrophica bacterium]|nr:glycosyltransferase family 2 protein [Candidatus Omnitrophota bacterium]